MKILRVRRGFTTNSSASSEWIPSQPLTPGGVSLRTQLSRTDDAYKVGGLIALVATAFALQRAARLVWRRIKPEPEDEGDDHL
jgi:hypothetical protein